MPRITIPKTIAQAKKALNGVGQLLTAKEWERAAIVYAFTEPADRYSHPKAITNSSSLLNLRDFAGLGIVGLNRPNSVAVYRKAWEEAVRDGAAEAKPGMTVTLPTREFPANPDSVRGTTASVRAALKKGTVSITDVIGEDESLREQVAEQVVNDPTTRQAVVHKILKTPVPVTHRGPIPPKPINWNEDLWRGLTLVLPALSALERDEFTPDFFNTTTLMLLQHVLPKAMQAVAASSGEAYEEAEEAVTEDMFSDIEAFLSKAISEKEAQS